MTIYYMYDAVTKQFIGEVQAPNQPMNSTELPPTREFNGKTYNLEDPVWDGEKWVGKNKELDVLDAIKDLSIQVAQNTAVLESVTGGDHENV